MRPRAPVSVGHLPSSTASFECRIVPAHVVGGDELLARKHRADFFIDVIDFVRPKWHGDSEVEIQRIGDGVVFRPDHDRDGKMARMLVRPLFDLVETDLQCQATRFEVDLLNVKHLHPGLVELGEPRVGVLAEQRQDVARCV